MIIYIFYTYHHVSSKYPLIPAWVNKIPRKTKHIVRRAPAMKIVTKICSFVTFVTIVQGTFLTFSVVRY